MSYIRTSNFPAGEARSHSTNQDKTHRWFVQHTFTNEITTIPQSIHNLIANQSVNHAYTANKAWGMFASRAHVELSSPGSVSGNPTIYIARSPLTEWPRPFTATGSEVGIFALMPNMTLDLEAGFNMDFLVWCTGGTAAFAFTEKG